MSYTNNNTPVRYVERIGLYSFIFMLMVLLLFLFGPIPWSKEHDLLDFVGIFLLLSYFISFYKGYRNNIPNNFNAIYVNRKFQRIDNRKITIRLLKVTIWISLIVTVLNAFEYAGVRSFSELFYKALYGLNNAAEVYYEKDVSSRAGTFIGFINLFFQPVVFWSLALSLFYFKDISILYKIIIVSTLSIELLRWFAIGTNKGLVDIIGLIISIAIIVKWKTPPAYIQKKRSLKERIIFLLPFALIFLFLLYFTAAIDDRTDSSYTPSYFSSYPYNLIPVGLRSSVEHINSYLTQGYYNMLQCFKYCDFDWTCGIGNSRFLMGVFEGITGMNLFERTYPAQLQYFGVDPLASWHSAYSWFASDLTFFGIIPFMYFIGKCYAKVVCSAIAEADSISIVLFYFFVLAIANSSCTNYVLAYTNMCSATIIFVIIKMMRRNG